MTLADFMSLAIDELPPDTADDVAAIGCSMRPLVSMPTPAGLWSSVFRPRGHRLGTAYSASGASPGPASSSNLSR